MINKHFEIGETVTYQDKKYKVIKRIGYFDNVKEQLIYDYILSDGEEIIAVIGNDLRDER